MMKLMPISDVFTAQYKLYTSHYFLTYFCILIIGGLSNSEQVSIDWKISLYLTLGNNNAVHSSSRSRIISGVCHQFHFISSRGSTLLITAYVHSHKPFFTLPIIYCRRGRRGRGRGRGRRGRGPGDWCVNYS